jgi:hypothetical protein
MANKLKEVWDSIGDPFVELTEEELEDYHPTSFSSKEQMSIIMTQKRLMKDGYSAFQECIKRLKLLQQEGKDLSVFKDKYNSRKEVNREEIVNFLIGDDIKLNKYKKLLSWDINFFLFRYFNNIL